MEDIIKNIEKVIVGKTEVIRDAVVSLLCRGHLLIEDVPGVGKTVLAKALSRSIKADFKRLQFTPDLLPSDVTGSTIFDQKKANFYFRKGPIFTNILLADEINRGTPRTQSSLLECMEEQQVSVDGETHFLPDLFFVIATQNPIELHGTYPLPEAQLDRFFMKISIGYPTLNQEVDVIKQNNTTEHPIKFLESVSNAQKVLNLQKEVTSIHIDESLINYIAKVVNATREHKDIQLGASPRGSLALCKASQACAILANQNFVKPDYIKDMAKPVLRHRIILQPQARLTGITPDMIIEEILDDISVPIS